GINSSGWPYVWDRVFGWKNDPRAPLDKLKDEDDLYAGNGYDSAADIGTTLLPGMEFPGRGAAYITLAILFFIAYWVVAGPGGYFFLSAKKRREWIWFG